jgi:hypothetical protein
MAGLENRPDVLGNHQDKSGGDSHQSEQQKEEPLSGLAVQELAPSREKKGTKRRPDSIVHTPERFGPRFCCPVIGVNGIAQPYNEAGDKENDETDDGCEHRNAHFRDKLAYGRLEKYEAREPSVKEKHGCQEFRSRSVIPDIHLPASPYEH